MREGKKATTVPAMGLKFTKDTLRLCADLSGRRDSQEAEVFTHQQPLAFIGGHFFTSWVLLACLKHSLADTQKVSQRARYVEVGELQVSHEYGTTESAPRPHTAEMGT